MSIAVVPALCEHVPAIFAMVRELAEFEQLTHLLTGTEAELERELFGAQPAIEAVVALQGDDVIGYALFFATYSTFLMRRGLWLEDIYVKPAYRKRGCGTALLKHVAALAVERGCGRFEWSVLNWNQRAMDFYQRFGATVMPDWRIVRLTGAALTRAAQCK